MAAASACGQTLKGVDVYRTGQLSSEAVVARLGSLPDEYARLCVQGRDRPAARLKKRMEAKVRAMGHFAFVELYCGQYANSAGRSAFLTFDLVDAADARARLPFHAAPVGRFSDPGGLLEAWKRYDATGIKQSAQGYIDDDAHPRCPGFYCRWGAPTKELAGLQDKLAAGAEPNKAALSVIAGADSDPRNRAAALYALSYAKDGADLAKLMLLSLDDPAPEPRAAALDVLSDLALYHKDIAIDLGRVAPVLDYPTVSDRAKAAALLLAKAQDPSARPALLSQAVPRLLPLLKLFQPSNHDPAFTILTMLSGESYDGRDYASWEKWIETQGSTASNRSPNDEH
jgi:hypothetical protein